MGIVGLLATFKDLLVAGRSNLLWGGLLDPSLVSWIVEWGYHSLFEELDPALFWQANIHHPATYATAYTDSLLGLQLLYGPLRLVGAAPLMSLYLSLALYALVGVLLSQHALNRLGLFTPIEQAVILFGAHFSLSVVNFMVHYQLFGFHLAPAFFVLLFVYFRDFDVRDLTLLCLTFFLGVLMSLYLGPFLLSMCLILVPVLLGPQIKMFGLRRLRLKVGPVAPFVVITFATALYFIQLRPYLLVSSRFAAPGIDVLNRYSAMVTSLFLSPSRHSLWYGPTVPVPAGYGESSYFPGFLLLFGLASTLILVGLHVMRRREGVLQDRRGTSAVATVSFLVYSLILFVTALGLSLGPSCDPQHLSDWLPFSLLRGVVPGLSQVRAPGRFGIFIGLPLGVFLVTAIRSIPPRIKWRTSLYVVALTALLSESLSTFELYPPETGSNATYQRVAQVLPKNAPLLELPIETSDHRSYLRGILAQMGGSTIHWGRLVVGYGAHTTPEHGELIRLDRLFRKDARPPRNLLAFARRNDIEFLLVHLRSYDAKHRKLWKSVLRREKVLMRHHGSLLVQLSKP